MLANAPPPFAKQVPTPKTYQNQIPSTSTHWQIQISELGNFSVVLIPSDSWNKAMILWRDTGSRLSTRHAEFCLEVLDYLSSASSNKDLCTGAHRKGNHHSLPQSLSWVEAAEDSVDGVKSNLARIATSEQPGQPAVSPDDVFLYPTGMNAIFSLSENLFQLEGDSSVAAFG